MCNNAPNIFRVCDFGLVQYNFILNTIFQKLRSQPFTAVPDVGKQGPRPCFGRFCKRIIFTHFNKCIYV